MEVKIDDDYCTTTANPSVFPSRRGFDFRTARTPPRPGAIHKGGRCLSFLRNPGGKPPPGASASFSYTDSKGSKIRRHLALANQNGQELRSTAVPKKAKEREQHVGVTQAASGDDSDDTDPHRKLRRTVRPPDSTPRRLSSCTSDAETVRMPLI